MRLATLTRWVLAHKRLVAGVWILVTIAAFAALQPADDALPRSSRCRAARGSRPTARSPRSTATAATCRAARPGRDAAGRQDRQLSQHFAAELDSGARQGADRHTSRRRRVLRPPRDDRTFVLDDEPHNVRPRLASRHVGVDLAGPGRRRPAGAGRARQRHRRRGAGEVAGLEELRAAAHRRSAGAARASPSRPPYLRRRFLGPRLRLRVVDRHRAAAHGMRPAADHLPVRLAAGEGHDVWSSRLPLGSSGSASRSTTRCWPARPRAGARHGRARRAVSDAMAHAGRAVVFSGTRVAISLLALVAPPSRPAQHRHRGPAYPARQRRGRGHAAAGRPGTVGPAGLAAFRRDGAPAQLDAWARIVVRHRRTAASLSTARSALGAAFSIQLGDPQRHSLAQAPRPAPRLEQLEGRGRGPGRCSPFARSSGPATPTTWPIRSPRVEGVQGTVAPPCAATAPRWSPRAGGGGHSPPAGTLDRVRAATAGRRRSSAARPPRAPTSSTASTAGSARHRADRRAHLRASGPRLPVAGRR